MKIDELEILADKMFSDTENVDKSKLREVFKIGFQMGYQRAVKESKERTLHDVLNDLEYK